FGVHTFGPAIAKFRFDGAAGELQPGLIEVGEQLVGAGHPDQKRRRIGDPAKALLALTHHLLCTATLRDIPDDDSEQLLPSSRVDLGYRRLNRKFLAGDSQGRQSTECTHLAIGHAGMTKSTNMPGVSVVETLRNETIQLSSDGFAGGAAECSLG